MPESATRRLAAGGIGAARSSAPATHEQTEASAVAFTPPSAVNSGQRIARTSADRAHRPLNRAKFILTLTVVVLLAASSLMAYASSAKTSLQEVSESLTCQCGCGLTVANCNHPQCESSLPLRQKIQEMIAKGMNRQQIVALFRKQYGEKILSAPTMEGFNLLAWIMPFAAIFAGCFLIVGALGRWRAGGPSESQSPDVTHPDDPELKRRLERDLQELR